MIASRFLNENEVSTKALRLFCSSFQKKKNRKRKIIEMREEEFVHVSLSISTGLETDQRRRVMTMLEKAEEGERG
jgi:hypothetical protein